MIVVKAAKKKRAAVKMKAKTKAKARRAGESIAMRVLWSVNWGRSEHLQDEVVGVDCGRCLDGRDAGRARADRYEMGRRQQRRRVIIRMHFERPEKLTAKIMLYREDVDDVDGDDLGPY